MDEVLIAEIPESVRLPLLGLRKLGLFSANRFKAYIPMIILVIILVLFPILQNTTPLGIWTMEEHEKLFRFVMVEQSIILPFCTLFIYSLDCMYLGICAEIVIQFRILSQYLQNLKPDGKKIDEMETNQLNEIKSFVGHHRLILRFVKEFRQAFSLVLLFEVVIDGPLICAELLAAFESLKNRENKVEGCPSLTVINNMPETMEIRELTRKRGGVNHKLTNFVKHVVPIYNTFKINPSLDDEVIIELQNRLDKLEIIYNEFEGIQLETESLFPDNVLEGHYKEHDDNVIANVRSKCNVRLASMHNNFNLKLSCYVLPTITGCLPNVEVNISDWKLPDNVSLADPKFNIPKQTDLLIGASRFWRIVRVGIIHLGKGMPVLQNTEFAYTVTGQINIPNLGQYCHLSTNENLTNNLKCSIQNDLQKFWLLEEVN
ncbi:hypothetical protein ILUMI_05680, partial [Ignelater luminosus]